MEKESPTHQKSYGFAMRIKKSTVFLLSFIFAFIGDASHAIDLTDVNKPNFSIKLLNNGANPFNAVIFEIQAFDDKNGIRLQDWRSGTEVLAGRVMSEFWTVGGSSENLAPVCTLRNHMLKVLIMDETVPNQDLDFTRKSRTYYLITLFEGIKLPDGCVAFEYRLTSEFSTLSVMDEAKNYALLSYPQKSFAVPANSANTSLCLGFGKNQSQDINNLTTRLNGLNANLQKNLANYPSFRSQFEKIQTSVASISTELMPVIESYSKFGSQPFNLDNFFKLPTCKDNQFLNKYFNLIGLASFELDSIATQAATQAAAERARATQKKTTITCIKGKLTKKVTAVNPKCPAGYKKK